MKTSKDLAHDALVGAADDIYSHLSKEIEEVHMRLGALKLKPGSVMELESPLCLGYIAGIVAGIVAQRNIDASPIETKYLLESACSAIYIKKDLAAAKIIQYVQGIVPVGHHSNGKESFDLGYDYATFVVARHGMPMCHGLSKYAVASRTNDSEHFQSELKQVQEIRKTLRR